MDNRLPEPLEYVAAVAQFDSFVLDPILRGGVPRKHASGFGASAELPLSDSGNLAIVFIVDVGERTYALRCWLRALDGIDKRYEMAAHYLAPLRLRWFVEFDFVRKGISIRGATQPILRMEWIGAMNLREFVDAHHGEPAILLALGEEFLEMSRGLHLHGIVHGDLQSDNIKVSREGSTIEVRLIDYDSLSIPSERSWNFTTLGLPPFQHPSRFRTPDAEDGGNPAAMNDRFSELVIFLSLMALAEDDSLWNFCALNDPDQSDKRLLFTADDFTSDEPTPVFCRLRKLSPLVSRLTLILWNFCRAPGEESLAPLEEAVRFCRGVPEGDDEFSSKLRADIERRFGVQWLQTEGRSDSHTSAGPPPLPVASDSLVRPVPSQKEKGMWTPSVGYLLVAIAIMIIVFIVIKGLR